MEHSHPNHHPNRDGHVSEHSHNKHSKGKGAFRWTILLNAGLTGLQLVIGTAFGSVALIGDAFHNLGDVLGLLLGWGAEELSRLSPTKRYTYGYGRSTQLAALVNGILILMAAAVVTVESIQRFGRPVDIQTGPVAWAAAAGVVVNVVSASLFGNDHHQDLNRRGAVMHLLSDAAVSGAVLLSAMIIQLTDWSWVDALTGVGVGVTIGFLGIDLIKEALAENLDAIPSKINLHAVVDLLKQLPGVTDVHHLHIWGISTSKVAMTVHLVRPPDVACDDQDLLKKAQQALAELGIDHTTIQLEITDDDHFDGCDATQQLNDA